MGTTCKPAIKAFPALMALARSFAQSEKKVTDFARLLVGGPVAEALRSQKEVTDFARLLAGGPVGGALRSQRRRSPIFLT